MSGTNIGRILIRSILSMSSPDSKTKIKHSTANSTTRHCLPLIRPMTPIWLRYVIIGSQFLLLFDRLTRIVERNIGLSGVVSDETRIVMRRLPYAPRIILLLPQPLSFLLAVIPFTPSFPGSPGRVHSPPLLCSAFSPLRLVSSSPRLQE
jgi:hypothetical protein